MTTKTEGPAVEKAIEHDEADQIVAEAPKLSTSEGAGMVSHDKARGVVGACLAHLPAWRRDLLLYIDQQEQSSREHKAESEKLEAEVAELSAKLQGSAEQHDLVAHLLECESEKLEAEVAELMHALRVSESALTEAQAKLKTAQLEACRMHYLGNLIRQRDSAEQAELNALMRKYPPNVVGATVTDAASGIASAWKELARANGHAFIDAHRELDEAQAKLAEATEKHDEERDFLRGERDSLKEQLQAQAEELAALRELERMVRTDRAIPIRFLSPPLAKLDALRAKPAQQVDQKPAQAEQEPIDDDGEMVVAKANPAGERFAAGTRVYIFRPTNTHYGKFGTVKDTKGDRCWPYLVELDDGALNRYPADALRLESEQLPKPAGERGDFRAGQRVLFTQLGTLVRFRRGEPVVKFDDAEEAICPTHLLSAVPADPAPPQLQGDGEDAPPGFREVRVFSDSRGTLSLGLGGFTTVRVCRHCGVLIAGGPTACMPCAAREGTKIHD